MIVKSSLVNLRSGPGTNYPVVGKASNGTKLVVWQEKNGWYQVQYGKGSAWVAGWLVNKVSNGTKVGQSSTTGANNKSVVVNASLVNLRSGPGTNYPVVGKASNGTKLVVWQEKNGWYQVQYGKGSAWVAGWLVNYSSNNSSSGSINKDTHKPPATAVLGTGFVAGNTVNLRSGPGTNYNILGQLPYGTPLFLLDKTNDWYQVRLSGGQTGWLIASLVQLGDHGGIIPVGGVSRGDVNRSDGQAVVPEDVDNRIHSSATVELQGVTHSVDGLFETVSLHLSNVTRKYNIFKLDNPRRLVVDIPDARPASGVTDVKAGAPLVSQIRVGYFSKEPDQVRVVLDLQAEVVWESKVDEQTGTIHLFLSPAGDKKSAGKNLIVLDAGHGGSDPGAIGKNGTKEKSINLDIVLRLAELLRRKGVEVLLTRSDDSYVDLYERTAIANRAGAALFVSVHCNSNQNSTYGGTSTYFVRTPAEENQQLQQHSSELARSLQYQLVKQLGRRDIGVLQANFVVLRTSTMPAALVEVAFLSNAEEEALLNDDSFRQKAAQAIADGVLNYLQQKMAAN
nr:N-acetylmuramoyl-L-alanine amidase [Desulfurispora thermophila]